MGLEIHRGPGYNMVPDADDWGYIPASIHTLRGPRMTTGSFKTLRIRDIFRNKRVIRPLLYTFSSYA